jgi:hypothetical protein
MVRPKAGSAAIKAGISAKVASTAPLVYDRYRQLTGGAGCDWTERERLG